MRTTQQFSITLPHDMAEAVESKIKSGAYASVSEVVRDGVRALLERDAAVERWLREEVVPGHQEYLRDPSKGVPADAILGPHQGAPRLAQETVRLCEGHLHAASRAEHQQPT
jgi:antitoxin ParD1/3/4